MKKSRLVGAKTSQRNSHNVPSTHEPRLRMSNDSAVLQLFFVQPAIHQVEVLAAMVNFVVVVSGGASVSDDHQVL
jgi:hypothetical protein